MSGPNRTVAAFRARKWTKVAERSTRDAAAVLGLQDALRAEFPGASIRTTSVKVGPRSGPPGFGRARVHFVRAYVRG